jgi:hypothetical protein
MPNPPVSHECTCLAARRTQIAARFATTDLPEADQPRAVATACYLVAVLAVDDTAMLPLTLTTGAWPEDFVRAVAAHFPRDILAVRRHLAREEQGIGQEVPEWLMETFVQWPMTDDGGVT